MDVKEFEAYLTMDELANFKANLKNGWLSAGRDEPIDYKQYIKMINADTVMTSSFVWNLTPEGSKYWLDIHGRFISRKPLTNNFLAGHDYMMFFTAEQWGKLCKIAMEHLGPEAYSRWMSGTHASITSFITTGIPASEQSKFTGNIRTADSSGYRINRGLIVKRGEFLTKEWNTQASSYTSTTRIHAGL